MNDHNFARQKQRAEHRKSKQTLIVNALPFELAEPEQTFHFYTEKERNRQPLQQKEYPERWKARHAVTAQEYDVLYTDFKTGDDGNPDFHISVTFDDAPAFTRRYLHKCLHYAFRKRADYRRTDFVNRVHLWFRDETADEFGFSAYKRFILSVNRYWFTEGWGLSVQFGGHSWLYPHAMISDGFDLDTTDVSLVAYRGHLFPYEAIPEEQKPEIRYEEVYPVVNYPIRLKHGAFSSPDPGRNKVRHYLDEIEWFRTRMLAGAIPENLLLPESSGWARIPGDSVYRLPVRAGYMVFGGGKRELNPYNGMKKHGPYRPADHPHIRFLFLMSERDRTQAGAEFYRYLKGEKSFTYMGKEYRAPSLQRFINLPGKLTRTRIIFRNEENPLPEIRNALLDFKPEPGITWFAFYITPIDREEADPAKKQVYYRVKEELLKKGISSQAVERSTILNTGFRYSLPNIYTAVLAKLGGIPWVLENPPEQELIAGVGAFRPREIGTRYLGSAICFRSNGTFLGLRCFREEEPHMLAGSIREAVHHYLRESGTPRRLVIHFYKTMSRKEWQPIFRELQNLGVSVPVVVLTIHKTEHEQTVLFDPESRSRLPLSGVFMNLRRNDVLLCNNTRYFRNSEVKKGFPFPVRIKLWCSEPELLAEARERQRLIGQVYQFSRLYWKSVSQQALPVTVAYPEMVAEKFPWFESLTLPGFGRKNLWFL